VKARGIPIISEIETTFCFIAIFNDTEGDIVNIHKRKASG
jgi:hypothetical protein